MTPLRNANPAEAYMNPVWRKLVVLLAAILIVLRSEEHTSELQSH